MRIMAAMVIVLVNVWPALAQSSQPSDAEMRQLQAENNMLRAQVKAQAAAIERLKAQLSQNAEPIASSQPATPSAEYTYLGKPITKAAFTALYHEFGTKMLYVDGKVLDTGEATAWEKYYRGSGMPNWIWGFVSDHVPLIGAQCLSSGAVTDVTGESVIASTNSGIPFRIRGLNVSKYPDGTDVDNLNIIYVGTCKVNGRTLQDYVTHAPAPTEAQFADALAKGLQLSRWRIQVKETGKSVEGVNDRGAPVQVKQTTPPEAVSTPVK
jgi:hypothetical protein